MGPYAQTFLDILSTAATLLRRKARGHSDHHMTSSLSLVYEDHEECAPTRVVNALGQMMVLDHPGHVQVLNTNAAILLRVVLGDLKMEVAALPADLEMLARNLSRGFAASVTAFLSAALSTLRVG